MSKETRTSFEQAAEQDQPGVVAEFLGMLRHNKKYWLLPIVLILLAFGLLVALGGSAAAPFIYTLF